MTDVRLDGDTGMPWLCAQRCLGAVYVERDGLVLGEVLVLPNLIVWLDHEDGPAGTFRAGKHRLLSPQMARMVVDEYLPDVADHVNSCDGEDCGHAGVVARLAVPCG